MTEKVRDSSLISDELPFLNTTILRNRILWSIRLRWLAIFGFLTVTYLVRQDGVATNYTSIYHTLFFLAVINTVYLAVYRLKRLFSLRYELMFLALHSVVDVLFLTFLIHLTGGIENPLYFFYIFHVIIGSFIFPGRWPYALSTLVFALFFLLVIGEFNGLIAHHCIYQSGFHDNAMLNMLIVGIFSTTVYLTTYICTGFMRLYRLNQKKIQDLNQRLMEKEKERVRFYRFSSHELKAPVVAIKTGIDTALSAYGAQMPGQAVHLLERAVRRAGQMLEMLKELLELSKFQQKLQKQCKKIELGQLLQQIMDAFKENARAKDIQIIYRESDVPVFVQAVEEDLRSVFNNLLSNAIRYNKPSGKVEINLRLESNRGVVKICDTGIGIDTQEKEKIFEPFYRTSEAKQYVRDGTGLGLSLTKQIVENMEGEISVHSQMGAGTCFEVKLPAAGDV